MQFRSNGTKQTVEMDGGELLALLKFKGKSEATSKIQFRVADSEIIAFARNGVGAELFIRGNASVATEYECYLESDVFSSIKTSEEDTVSISCGPKPKLSLTHKAESEPRVEFAIHNYFSAQTSIENAWVVPTRPVSDLDAPWSIDLDWGLYGLLQKVVGYSGSNRVRQYTARESGSPLYVEFGLERSDGLPKWFATFAPYVEDDCIGDEGGKPVDVSTKDEAKA
jgi:hypothetical protein